MLKFTKYGRNASAGNFSITAPKEKRTVILTSFTEVANKASAEKIQCSHVNTSKPVDNEVGPPPPLPQSFVHRDSKVHLLRSKLSKEELIKLESKEIKRSSERFEAATNQFCRKRMDSLVAEKSHSKVQLRKYTSASSFRDTTGSMKIQVYNDGYFPRVQPLSKFFIGKQADSEEMSSMSNNAQG